MELTKFEIKVLKYLRKHPSGISRAKLLCKYQKRPISDALNHIVSNQYAEPDRVAYIDEHHAVIPSDEETKIIITTKGIVEIEGQQWFDTRFIVTSLLVPIFVGAVSSVITALLLALFS